MRNQSDEQLVEQLMRQVEEDLADSFDPAMAAEVKKINQLMKESGLAGLLEQFLSQCDFSLPVQLLPCVCQRCK